MIKPEIDLNFKLIISLFGAIFFFNDILPFGLTLGLIFTPIFFLCTIKWNQVKPIIAFGILLSLINSIHLYKNANIQYLVVSSIVLMAVFTTGLVFWYISKHQGLQPHHIKRLTTLNGLGVLLALVFFFIPQLKSLLWYEVPFTLNYDVSIPRLKLFTLEASHYSLIIMPLFLYYFIHILKQFNFKKALLFFSLLFALSISFSLGVILVITISIGLFTFYYIQNIYKNRYSRNLIIYSLIVICSILIGLYIFYPENPLYFRIGNIFIGDDTSGRGRTYEAFDIAWKVLNHQNNDKWFGIGLGQFKEDGRQLLIQYYHYTTVPDVVRLPNALAETLVTFGIVGLCGKLILQVYLFFKTKVYNNVFQFILFVAIFIYQFTGSYIFNLTEYFIWILAFTPVFSNFNKDAYFNNNSSKI